jgi:hypothetical protein
MTLGNGRDGIIWAMPPAEAFAKLISFERQSSSYWRFELREVSHE